MKTIQLFKSTLKTTIPNLMIGLSLLMFALWVLASGCQTAVKKVLRDPEKFNQVADEVFRRGLCVNDTIVTYDTSGYRVVFDTIYTISDTGRISLEGFIPMINTDSRDFMKPGELLYKPAATPKPVIRTVYRDRDIIKTLTVKDQKELETAKKDHAKEISVLEKRKNAEINALTAELKHVRGVLRKTSLVLYPLLILILIWGGIRLYRFIAKLSIPVPFI
jgi:hypothetical protein